VHGWRSVYKTANREGQGLRLGCLAPRPAKTARAGDAALTPLRGYETPVLLHLSLKLEFSRTRGSAAPPKIRLQ